MMCLLGCRLIVLGLVSWIRISCVRFCPCCVNSVGRMISGSLSLRRRRVAFAAMSSCGVRPGVGSWVCPVCGARLDRQWNAAWVIRLVGVCQLLDEVNFSPSSGVLADLSAGELSWLRFWWYRRQSDRFWNGQVKDVRRKFDVIQDLANVLEAVIASGGLLETSRAERRI